jgi:hypothetical protein
MQDGFEILKEAKRCEFEGRKYTMTVKAIQLVFLAHNIIIFIFPN